MASETTVPSDLSTAPEQVEKVNEEVKEIQQEDLPPSNGGGEEEKPKIKEPASQPTVSSESEEKMEDKKIEPSPAEEDVKRSDDASVSVETKSNTTQIPESDHQKLQELLSVEALEKQPAVNDALEQSAEGPEAAVVEDIKHSGAEPKKEEISQPVHGVEDKPEEESEVAERVENVNVEISGSKIEDFALKEGETAEGEPVATESPNQIKATNMKAHDDSNGGDQGEHTSTVVSEFTNADNEEKALNQTNVVEGLVEEQAVEPGKVEFESGEKNGETEEEKKVIVEESLKAKTNNTGEVNSSVSPLEVIEKSLEGDGSSGESDLVAENGKETINDGADGKVEEPQKSGTEVKGEEAVQTGEANLEKENEDGKIAKPDVPAPEFKDHDDIKASEKPAKEEAPAKPASKQSNNLIAKVKKSLLKAKKAIIGKSPDSKTVSSETKSEVKDK